MVWHGPADKAFLGVAWYCITLGVVWCSLVWVLVWVVLRYIRLPAFYVLFYYRNIGNTGT